MDETRVVAGEGPPVSPGRGMVLLAGGLAWVALCGCTHQTLMMPPTDAPAEAVLQTFLNASRSGDSDVGEQLAGDCWPKVKGWYANSTDRLRDFTISESQNSITPASRTTRVRFTWTTDQKPQGRWVGELTRPDADHRWTVCSLHPDS